MVDVEQTRRGRDQMDLAAGPAQSLEKADGVDRARSPGYADDDATGALGHGQAAMPSVCCSSPAWYISVMMSEPPTNSPLT